jgi:uroporphyrin-III C-methyltransferase
VTGFVSFVGSGPGDPALLTLKAVDCLKTAQVVLFDDLSSGPILKYAGAKAELIGVGKRAGRRSPKQDHVSRLLVDYAGQGYQVVRLKSGDPGVFGRLEEEIDALRAANLPFEIVPGVTAASAAAAAAGIPLSRRFTARRIQFVTGHDVAGALPEDLNISALTDPNATTVIYMPKRTFASLAELLIQNGLPKTTPALLAESISTPEQYLQRTTLHSLAQQLSKDISSAPGLILYGALAETSLQDVGVGCDLS